MTVLKKVLLYKYLLFIIFLIIILLSFYRVNVIHKSVYNENETEFILKVLSIKHKDNIDTVTLVGRERIISDINDFPYNVGDIVKIKGKLIKPDNNTIPNTFNYYKYLQSRKINWKLKVNNIMLVKGNSNIFYSIQSQIGNRIRKIAHNEYLYTFILGDTSYINSDMKDKYQSIGLSYVLSIGSLQIMMITSLLNKLKVSVRKKLILKTVVIITYILFTNLVIGVLRSGLCYIIKSILKYKKVKYKYSNIILIVGTMLLIINPHYIINIGFLYSFSISLAISLLRDKIKGSSYKKLIKISMIAFLISMPITMYSNYEINFLAVIFGVILIPLYRYIIFPFSIVVFIFPFLSIIYEFIITFAESIVTFFSDISFLTFVFKRPSMLIIIMYYLLISLFFYKRKYILLLIIILFIHHKINIITREKIVTFLDVKQGDAIILKNNNYLSLIDTGNRYSAEIIKYIKSLGLSKINSLVLTHGDFDHMGTAINIVNDIKIEKVIFNCGEFNEYEQELIKVLNKKKIEYYTCIKKLNVNNDKLYFLQTREYNDENDNSNVIYTKINGYKFMFMGDASVNKEKNILDKYNISNVDVLKVGHHGSKTSSSKEFINKINPQYSIISVGKNNKYGHPNKEVLSVLENSKIYRTDQDGSIMFKITNNKLQIETCGP